MKTGVPYLVELTGMTPEFIRQKLKEAGIKKKGRAYTWKSRRAAELEWSRIHKPYGHTLVYVKEMPVGPIYVRKRVSEGHYSK